MNTDSEVIGLTLLGIQPKSRAPEVDALTTWPSELFVHLSTFVIQFRDRVSFA